MIFSLKMPLHSRFVSDIIKETTRLLSVRRSEFPAKKKTSEQRKYTHKHKTYINIHIFSQWQVQKQNKAILGEKKKKDKSEHLIINEEKNPTYLVTARVQMVTRKQPATIIQPQPPSGGEVDRALFTFAMVFLILYSSFPSYSNSPVMILEECAV